MKNICVLGAGYVGLVTGACFADLGNKVICLDIDESKIEALNRGDVPIYEPGLAEVLLRNVRSRRLNFSTSYEDALKTAEFVFIAVGTPSGVDGEADLQYVRMAAKSIAKVMDHPLIIINKSTVPVGTGDWVADIIKKHQEEPIPFWVVSNPEFLREGSAIHDFMNPDRVVLGSLHHEAAEKVAQLHLPLRTTIQITDLRTAEMIKYASNAFLATRISFINEIATICERLGADVKEVAVGMGYDKRIGPAFLDAGLGFGGSCFPKDVRALEHMALIHDAHPQLLRAVLDINRHQRRQVVVKLRQMLGGLNERRVGLLGLSFKPNTDDMREAPAVDIARQLHREGAYVQAYDPVSGEIAARILPDIRLAESVYEVAKDADALVVVTEWNEFRHLDMERIRRNMAGKVLLDGRNIWDPEEMAGLGFVYSGVGRGVNMNSSDREGDLS
ncbi:MAG: UDP-glucose/GDP-mannose dehydrogenase family protein [Chloroflexi bacterium]|nr:UDP-glucose/GDP-mannose dehydrogenase family protein [Chloroflexota bacterium]